MEKENKKEGITKIWRQSAPYLGLGSFFTISIAGGLLLGYWIDKKLGTTPWLTLMGTILGFILGFYHFFKVVLNDRKKKDH
jgi:F0F1-type ATP synthase assembly protein I